MKQLPPSAITTVIFDFDGTLADSLEIFLSVGQELLDIDHKPTKAEIEQLRSMKPLEIMKMFDIKPWKIPKLLLEGRKVMAGRSAEIKVFDGVPEMLRDLKAQGYRLYVVSTNAKNTISAVMRRNDLNKLVSGTYAGASITGKSVMIKKLMKLKKLAPSECVYIGDELRDIEAARKAKTHIVSVAWGYNSEKLLKTADPDVIINRPGDLASTLQNL